MGLLKSLEEMACDIASIPLKKIVFWKIVGKAEGEGYRFEQIYWWEDDWYYKWKDLPLSDLLHYKERQIEIIAMDGSKAYSEDNRVMVGTIPNPEYAKLKAKYPGTAMKICPECDGFGVKMVDWAMGPTCEYCKGAQEVTEFENDEYLHHSHNSEDIPPRSLTVIAKFSDRSII